MPFLQKKHYVHTVPEGRLNYMLDISNCILFLLLTGFKPLGPCSTFDGEFAAKAKKVGNCFQLGKCIDSQDLEN